MTKERRRDGKIHSKLFLSSREGLQTQIGIAATASLVPRGKRAWRGSQDCGEIRDLAEARGLCGVIEEVSVHGGDTEQRRSQSNPAKVKLAVRAVSGTCRQCHTDFRTPDDNTCAHWTDVWV